MSIKPTNKHMKHYERTILLLTLVVLTLAPPVYGKVALNTIDSIALVNDQGRHIIATVIATGSTECREGSVDFIRVTVTQRTTGAVAEGRSRSTCIGPDSDLEVHAATQGKESFEEGAATAVALVRTTERGVIVDAKQWLVNITLVEE